MKRFFSMMLLVILATALVAAPFVEDVLLTPSTNPRTGGRLYMTLDTAPQSFNFYGTLDKRYVFDKSFRL